MDKVTKVKKHLKAEQWKTLIAECQSSGMTVKSWCELNHICIATYYRNLHKLRMEVCEKHPEIYDNLPAIPEEKPVTFEPLKVNVPLANTQAAVVIHLNQATLEVHQGADRETVEAVLLALKSIC